MLIANPLYDIVFKNLMEDTDIAKGFISSLLGEEVLELHFASESQSIQRPGPPGKLDISSIYRRDFIARIRTKQDTEKRVVIEVQKSRLGSDILRFRTYLGRQYQEKEDVTNAKGQARAKCLEIVAVFILGFDLNEDLPAVIKVDRTCVDRFTSKVIKAENDYVKLFNYISYLVQTRKLTRKASGDLERVLSVFSQQDLSRYKARLVDYPAEDETNPLVQKMLRKLSALGADQEVRAQMETEDQIFAEIAMAVETLRDDLEEERRKTREAEVAADEERRQKEEAQRQKEEAQRLAEEQRLLRERGLAAALDALLNVGIPEAEAREKLGLI